MRRCATGEHRGTTLLELAAVTQAAIQQAISEGIPGYEHFVAVQHSARRLWPHMCAPEPLSRYCWQYDRSFAPEGCNGLRAFIEAYSSEDALDQYDWHAEQRCPNLCAGARELQFFSEIPGSEGPAPKE